MKGSETDSLAPEVLTTTKIVVLVTCVIYERYLPLLQNYLLIGYEPQADSLNIYCFC